MTEPTRPNAIIIMVDQMKATASHLYGPHGIHTPGLERLAKLGVRFENAITPHPLCVPARVAMWTAKYPHRTNCRLNQTLIRKDMPHAGKWWHEAGYQLALLGKNHCFEEAADRDLFDVWCEITHRGFSDPSSPKGMAWVEPESAVTDAHSVRRNMPKARGSNAHAATGFDDRHYSTGLLSNQSDAYLRERKTEPFVLWLSVPDPHTPYEAPQHFFDEALAQGIELPPPGPVPGDETPKRNQLLSQMLRWPDDQIDDLRHAVAAYHANVLHIDKLVDRLLHTLEETDQLDNTVIVFCSDHGDFAGERQMMAKGGAFYDCLVRIPMIIAAPTQLAKGQTISAPVSLLDVVPTLFQLQGLSLPGNLDGQAMPPLHSAQPRRVAFSEYGTGGPPFEREHLRTLENQYGHAAIMESLIQRESEGERSMIRTETWKFVHDPMGDRDELYQLQSDPYELTNIASDPAFSAIKKELMAELYDWRQWA